jgi:hypothetical protein
LDNSGADDSDVLLDAINNMDKKVIGFDNFETFTSDANNDDSDLARLYA